MSKNNISQNKQEIESLLKVRDYRRMCESNIVTSLWKNPDLYYTYDNLDVKNFIHKEWKTFFAIGQDLILRENKKTLDVVTVNMYLEKREELKSDFEDYGGFESINSAMNYVYEDNIEGYVSELNKWIAVTNLSKHGFHIGDKLKDFISMTAEEIYEEYEANLNNIFANIGGEDGTYKLSHNIDKLIDELDEGLAVGLPLNSIPIISTEIGGNLEGNITLCGGLSGVGKTAFSRSVILPSIIDFDETIVVMINEEGLQKWQREMIIWVANNIYHNDFQKYKLRNGKYSPDVKSFLKDKCVGWIKEKENNIIIHSFKNYSTSKAIKVIKKYAYNGIKYFMLDTFKADANASNNDAFWLSLQQNMVKLYDTIKSESLNVHLWITFQLAKSSSKQRCYTQDNVGMAKNIIDVASTCLMIRNVFEDEFDGGKNELKIYKQKGKSTVPVKLVEGKHYQLVFIVKNREGASNEKAIVIEHDLSRNIIREIGITVVPVDF